jgi:hypothetical protein
VPREDRERLADFADSAYRVLATVVHEHEGWLPLDLIAHYRTGLNGAEVSLGQVQSALLPETWVDAPNEGAVESLETRLGAAGLLSPHLDLKLAGYSRAERRFRASPAKRLLKSVLRWANVLLGSIVVAVGAGEALKELKEAIEAGVEDQEDAEAP